MRETGAIFKRLVGNEDVAGRYLNVARTLLGRLKARLGAVQVGAQRWRLSDGVRIKATKRGAIDGVEIDITDAVFCRPVLAHPPTGFAYRPHKGYPFDDPAAYITAEPVDDVVVASFHADNPEEPVDLSFYTRDHNLKEVENAEYRQLRVDNSCGRIGRWYHPPGFLYGNMTWFGKERKSQKVRDILSWVGPRFRYFESRVPYVPGAPPGDYYEVNGAPEIAPSGIMYRGRLIQPAAEARHSPFFSMAYGIIVGAALVKEDVNSSRQFLVWAETFGAYGNKFRYAAVLEDDTGFLVMDADGPVDGAEVSWPLEDESDIAVKNTLIANSHWLFNASGTQGVSLRPYGGYIKQATVDVTFDEDGAPVFAVTEGGVGAEIVAADTVEHEITDTRAGDPLHGRGTSTETLHVVRTRELKYYLRDWDDDTLIEETLYYTATVGMDVDYTFTVYEDSLHPPDNRYSGAYTVTHDYEVRLKSDALGLDAAAAAFSASYDASAADSTPLFNTRLDNTIFVVQLLHYDLRTSSYVLDQMAEEIVQTFVSTTPPVGTSTETRSQYGSFTVRVDGFSDEQVLDSTSGDPFEAEAVFGEFPQVPPSLIYTLGPSLVFWNDELVTHDGFASGEKTAPIKIRFLTTDPLVSDPDVPGLFGLIDQYRLHGFGSRAPMGIAVYPDKQKYLLDVAIHWGGALQNWAELGYPLYQKYSEGAVDELSPFDSEHVVLVPIGVV